ncbi:hypothetical protein C8F01DRAFT_1084472 [Mycena amicta]|nr:hypothetical protein C8F01DRAFT_1084472 [Mycena amicta]
MAFTSGTRTKGSVAHEGTTDAPRNGEVLKKEFWNEGMSRPGPKAPPGFRKGEEEPENTKGKNRVNTEKEKKETNQKSAERGRRPPPRVSLRGEREREIHRPPMRVSLCGERGASTIHVDVGAQRGEGERDVSPTHEGVVTRKERSVNHPRGWWCATRRGDNTSVDQER